MTPSPMEVIRQVYVLGGRLRIEGESLVMEAPQPLPDGVRQAVKEHKPAIMVALGSPMNTVVSGILAEIRPHLSESLQHISDDDLLALVNLNIMVAWKRAIAAVVADA